MAQRCHGLTCHGIEHIRGDLRQRLEHEAPLSEARVRDDEVRLLDDGRAKQDQVEVEGPGRAGIRTLAGRLPFQHHQEVQERAGVAGPLPDDRAIEKPRLRANSDGVRLDEVGHRGVREAAR